MDEELLVAHLAALAELAKSAPYAFEQKSDVIVGFLVKQVLMQLRPSDEVCALIGGVDVISSSCRTLWKRMRKNGGSMLMCPR